MTSMHNVARMDANDDSIIRIHATVTGMVQGVGFRYYTVEQARKLAVSGWVCNRLNGSVEVEAQGPRADIAQLISWLKVGPRWARVDQVQVTEIPCETGRDARTRFRVIADY